MATMYNNGDIDIYMFTDPTFNSVEECLVYAQNNPGPIIGKLSQEFNGAPLKNLLCVSEDKLKESLEIRKDIKI